MLRPADVHELLCVEVLHFGGDPAWVGGCVECGDVVDRGVAGNEIAPKGVLANAVWRDDAQSGNHDAALTPTTQRSEPPLVASVPEQRATCDSGTRWAIKIEFRDRLVE
jgi:hypothetical protein